MLTKEQLEERRLSIGASDAASVLGLSPWRTILETWADKVGAIPVEQTDSIAAWFGTEAEELVAKRFCMETKKKVQRVNEKLVHPEHPFITCHLDRKVVGERAILQIKTASAYKENQWKDDEIPAPYIIQEVVEMAISGYEKAYIACLIGNHKFAIRVLNRNLELEKDVISKLAKFWNEFVIPKKMPMTITANDSDILYKLYPLADTSEIRLPDECNKICESITAMVADQKLLDTQIDQSKNELKAMLKDSLCGTTDTYRVTWTPQTKKFIDTERLKKENMDLVSKYQNETSMRVLRVKNISKKEG